MSGRRTKKHSDRREAPVRGRADLKRLRGLSEKEIAQTSPPELHDLPADFWSDAEVVTPQPKEAISLRVDQDVLAWFREEGPRYQSRMNAVLRSYMVAIEKSRQRENATRGKRQGE